jgi:hypothetical protein
VSNIDFALQIMGMTDPVEDRIPFIQDGDHVLALVGFRTFPSKNHGESIGATLLVLESSNPAHPKGSLVFKGFYVNRAPKFPNDKTEPRRCADFTSKIVGGQHAQGGQIAGQLLQATQPGRGLVIKCKGVRKLGVNKDKSPKLDEFGKQVTYVDLSWEHVEGQTPEQIKAVRDHIEATVSPKELSGGNVPQQQAAPVVAPAPQAAPVVAPAPQAAPVVAPQAAVYAPAPVAAPVAPAAPAPTPTGAPSYLAFLGKS